MRAAIVYDCIPHYRAAVMRELLLNSAHDYHLIADERTLHPTVKPWAIEDRTRFSSAPCHQLIGPIWYQQRVISLGFRPDIKVVVFMAYSNFVSTWISALLCRLAGKRVLFWTHGWIRSETGLKSWIRVAFYKLASGLMLYGHTAKFLGLQRGFASERLHVIYNSLDYERQKQIRESIAPGESASMLAGLFSRPELPLVICTARLIKSCQFDLLLQAQAQLREGGHEINVLLVGEGPERAPLEILARQLSLPVCFYGACYDESLLARLILGAHVTVSPGKVGLTAMHSLAYGTPVVTHDDHEAQGPEWEAIVPGRTGDFFCRGDIDDLARLIRKWTQSPPTPATRTACHQLLDRFYNPAFQRRAIDRAVKGSPADDLFWLKETAQASPTLQTA